MRRKAVEQDEKRRVEVEEREVFGVRDEEKSRKKRERSTAHG